MKQRSKTAPKRALKNGGGKKGGELAMKPAAAKSTKAPAEVEFTPDRTLPLTVNGRTIEVHAGAKTKVPPEYHAVYLSAR